MMPAGTQIYVLKEGTRRDRGKGAQFNNIAAARAVAGAGRSTLGPRGMDKMLVDSLGDVVITNDGVTILKEIDIEHPAAKMIVEVAKTQDQEAGDGTTTAVILAGELLKKAEEMIEQNIHPTVIAQGYRMASEKANAIIEKVARPVTPKDRETLIKIARTAMSSKSASSHSEMLAEVCVKAVTMVAEERDGKWHVDDDNIQVTKTEIDAKIEITDPAQLQAFLNEEESVLRKMVDRVKKSGANALFCQKGIDDLVQHYLAKEGIYAVRRVKKTDVENIR